MNRGDIWVGVGCIFLGVGFGGDVIGIWNIETFLSAWWILFMIVPVIINILENGVQRGNMTGLALASALTLAQWFPSFRDFVVSYVFIILGAILLLIPSSKDN